MDGLVTGRGEGYLTTVLCWFGGPVRAGGFHCLPLTAAEGYVTEARDAPHIEAEDPSVSRMVIQGATTSCYLALSF